jgi:hypothetical protein
MDGFSFALSWCDVRSFSWGRTVDKLYWRTVMAAGADGGSVAI